MPLVIPVERRIICFDDESYSVPVEILDERMLTMEDEELIEALALYKPRCIFKQEDIVELTGVPKHLENRELVPRFWKIRFVITRWAHHLASLALQYGGGITLSQATHMLEKHHDLGSESSKREAMIYAHGYPHGEYPDSTAWFLPHHLKKTLLRENQMTWPAIVDEAKAEYLGYDTSKFPARFCLDLAPDNYSDGRNLERPFMPEEPLVNSMYDLGLEEMLHIPFMRNERDKVRKLEEDHDIYVYTEDEEEYRCYADED